MLSTFLDQLNELIPASLDGALGYAAAGATAIVVAWIVWRVLRRKRQEPPPLPPNLTVDVESLGAAGPPEVPPTLEFYNLPVRLAAIVLAPAGRAGELPPDEELGPLLDAIVPGLDQVAASHVPLVRRWPRQLSARGFAHLFFNHARLPGAGGKGTPWSSVAGGVKVEDRSIMAGLILRAARPNGFGQTIVDSEGKWLGCLRVRWS